MKKIKFSMLLIISFLIIGCGSSSDNNTVQLIKDNRYNLTNNMQSFNYQTKVTTSNNNETYTYDISYTKLNTEYVNGYKSEVLHVIGSLIDNSNNVTVTNINIKEYFYKGALIKTINNNTGIICEYLEKIPQKSTNTKIGDSGSSRLSCTDGTKNNITWILKSNGDEVYIQTSTINYNSNDTIETSVTSKKYIDKNGIGTAFEFILYIYSNSSTLYFQKSNLLIR